jgi:menaquinone-9 beta-reductase
MAEHFDLVIVGGGIGGGALATVLSRAGASVLLLEKSTVYRDHVRGEWISPWGVAELQQLDLYDAVRSQGGHHLARHWSCYEERPAEEAVAGGIDLTSLYPGVPGPLCIGHPAFCQLLIDLAARAGATVQRGVEDVRVSAGASPTVTYRFEGSAMSASCRLVVGADGRGSQVRRQAGIELHRDSTHHLFAGMLVEDAHGWPADTQMIATEGDVNCLAFPQGNGRVRLYLGYSNEQPKRLTGADGPRAFLAAFQLACLPGAEHLARAQPAGPCHSYPNEDTWTDLPMREGVVLVGDAAGSNDPIIGQGLSITLRDVRLVREALLGSREWRPEIFTAYASERAERMRRLRFSASVVTTLDSEFGEEARKRRIRAHERQAQDPNLLLPMLAALLGPDRLPAEAFEEETRRRLFAEAP